MATKEGARYRSTVLENHFTQAYHKECVKADRLKSLQPTTAAHAPLDVSMQKANQIQADYVGKLLIQIFADAKRLTLSAWSWPMRFVASEASHVFSIRNENHETIPKNISLQYINNKSHLVLMSCIVEADVNSLKSKIEDCLALSLRVDGSVDRTQLDKIYVMAKLVSSKSATELIFLGVKVQTERLAAGLFKTVIGAMEDMFGYDFVYNVILMKVSSICTDGTNVNSGDEGGIWKYLEDEMIKIGSKIPLVKIWCAAHRADLVFDDLSKTTPEAKKILDILSSIASYFHVSAIRTAELLKIAAEIGIKLLSMPKLFSIRWTQFTFQLVRSISVNWRALVLYFARDKDAQAQGFHTYLTNAQNVRKIAFFADVLFIFQRFQKKMQSNSLTLLKMSADVKKVIASLENLKNQSIPGGVDDKLAAKIVTERDKQFLNGVELVTVRTGRRAAESNIDSFKKTVIDSLTAFLRERLQFRDEELLMRLDALLKFDNPDAVKKVHELVGHDLDLASLYLQYSDLCEEEKTTEMPLDKMVKHLAAPERIVHFREITTILARILACTPHSADVERCISANNLLKTSLRSNLAISTENKYLYIYFNMPVLENWNPRAAITKWMSTSRRSQSRTIESNISKKQPFFKGVFDKCDSDEESVSDSDIQLNVNAF